MYELEEITELLIYLRAMEKTKGNTKELGNQTQRSFEN